MIDTFLIFNLILIIFGVQLKIWQQSRTTFFVFILMLVVIFELKFHVPLEKILLTLWFFSTLLFCRAVFRKFILNSKYQWFA